MINNLRYIAVLILDDVLNKGAYSNISLKEHLDKSDLRDIDKKLVTEIVYGTIRYKLTIDMILSNFVKKLDEGHIVTMILRSSIYQLKYLDKIPDYSVLNESVEIAKKLCKNKSGFVNGVLRNYLRRQKSIKIKENTLEYEYSFATWMINLLKDQYPSNYKSIMENLNKRSETCYRVNESVISKGEFLREFMFKYSLEDLSCTRNAFKMKNVSNISKSKIFKEGLISVQGLSSQIACEVLDPKENNVIIDLCGAPGGKSTYIAELINNKGKVYSCDVHNHRLDLIRASAKRLKLNVIECILNDGTKLNERFLNLGDKVLLDAPCSGLGVINKKPEIKWFKNPKDLEGIINIQRKMIEVASKYVKKEGVLMYTTCTINKDENEGIIREFLKRNKDFEIEGIDSNTFSHLEIQNNDGMITIFPSEITNGFFITRLRRR